MELTLVGHDSLYQVEQLQQALFSLNQEGTAVSKVERTEDAVRFITTITVGQGHGGCAYPSCDGADRSCLS